MTMFSPKIIFPNGSKIEERKVSDQVANQKPGVENNSVKKEAKISIGNIAEWKKNHEKDIKKQISSLMKMINSENFVRIGYEILQIANQK